MKKFTKQVLKAALKVGGINANETARMFRGRPPRERPPGLVEAYAELQAAQEAAPEVIRHIPNGRTTFCGRDVSRVKCIDKARDSMEDAECKSCQRSDDRRQIEQA